MNTNPTENPPAFPRIQTTERLTPNSCGPNVHSVGGMTLRDYFAAKAMHGIINHVLFDQKLEDIFKAEGNEANELPEFAADVAYSVADAMLKARAQPMNHAEEMPEPPEGYRLITKDELKSPLPMDATYWSRTIPIGWYPSCRQGAIADPRDIRDGYFATRTPLVTSEAGQATAGPLRYESVADLREAHEGKLCEKKCPKCGSSLLRNKIGDEWCSFVECDFGVEETAKKHVAPPTPAPDEKGQEIARLLTKPEREQCAKAIRTAMNPAGGLFIAKGWNVILSKLEGDFETAKECIGYHAANLEVELATLRAQLSTAKEIIAEAKGALDHERRALTIVRDRQNGQVGTDDLNQGIRLLDAALARIAEFEKTGGAK